MSRINRLEALLARVTARAAEPRPVAQAAALKSTPLEDAVPLEAPLGLDEAAESPPIALAPALVPDAVEAGFDLDEPGLDEPDLDEPVMVDEPLEVSDVDLAEVQEVDDIEIDDIDDMEEQPESGQVASTTMDDAIDAAEHQPPLTPPPESGEGFTSPQIPQQGGPTMAQLGQTISLEEGRQRDFELDEPIADDEMASGPQASATIREEDADFPEDVQEELDRMRLGKATPIEARVASRPVVTTNVVQFVSASRTFEPKSFLELLDSSLKLR